MNKEASKPALQVIVRPRLPEGYFEWLLMIAPPDLPELSWPTPIERGIEPTQPAASTQAEAARQRFLAKSKS